MADQPQHETLLTRFCWWLVHRLSRLLEGDERDAVLGDFAESGERAERALRDMLGVIARRQAVLWLGWRPWLILLFLVIPFGVLLSYTAQRIAESSAIYIWLYANNWHWAYLGNPGFWAEFAHVALVISISLLTLVCWAWSTGFVLGRVSGRFRFQSVFLFCPLLFSAELLGAVPGNVLRPFFLTARHVQGNNVVFAVRFYGTWFPLLAQIGLVAAPVLWGVRQNFRAATLSPLVRTILWMAAITTLAAFVMQDWGFVAMPYRGAGLWSGWHVKVLQLVVYWPIGYLIATMIERRRQRKVVTT